MSKEKLNNLIDKVIGKDGPLRVPAYWMRKVLKNIGDSINDVEKNLDKLKNYVVTNKADKIPIKDSSSVYNGIKPNVYVTYTLKSTGHCRIALADIADSYTYNEYIMEIKCTSTPASVGFIDSNNTEIAINWANGNSPSFEAGYTYIISIVNNFGVFAQFTNS